MISQHIPKEKLMAKILLMISAFIMLAIVIIVIYYAKFFKGNSNRNENNGNNNDEYGNKHICSDCKTGKDTYNIDPKSEICPYIECLKNGKCSFYVPLEEPSKANALKTE